MSHVGDTIVAIATATGRAGVGIVRVSGPRVRVVAEAIAGTLPAPRVASLRHFRRSDADASVIDQGLLIYFPAPFSFTGEDVVELQAHGSPIVLAEMVEVLCAAGARIARPGEFSERAFLNGRMDLAQAEAVADLIDASSRDAARAAARSMQGDFSKCVQAAVESLIELRVLLEAALDFADEDVPAAAPANVSQHLDEIAQELARVQHLATQGRRLREGMRVAIAGAPNVGKSTLLNRLAGAEAAIVSPQAGTTRDVLREHIVVDGLPLTLIDTAGLRVTEDPIEREGVRRAHAEIAQAELVLVVLDDRDQYVDADDIEQELLQICVDAKRLIVRNKCDLSGAASGVGTDARDRTCVRISAAMGEGCDVLIAEIKKCAGLDDGATQVYSARARHLDALKQAAAHLFSAQSHATAPFDAVLIAEELRLAQRSLEAITGQFSSEDLLGRIFSSFCLGK